MFPKENYISQKKIERDGEKKRCHTHLSVNLLFIYA